MREAQGEGAAGGSEVCGTSGQAWRLWWWAARMLLFGALMGPAGWVSRRLLFPPVASAANPLFLLWLGALLSLVFAVLAGVVVVTIMFVAWPYAMRDFESLRPDVASVAGWYDRRWGERGVYLVAAVFATPLAMGSALINAEHFSGPVAGYFLDAVGSVSMLPLAALSGVVLRVAWTELRSGPGGRE